MSYTLPPDLESLVHKQMATGGYATEDEVLRDALRALAEEQADWEAVKTVLDEAAAGDAGIPVDEAFDEVRRRHSSWPTASSRSGWPWRISTKPISGPQDARRLRRLSGWIDLSWQFSR